MVRNPFSQVRILVVDDIAAIRRLLLYMLRSFGYTNIAVADDGTEAWKIIQQEKIDLVISDWNMPRMTGIELLYRVRSTYPYEDLPFILVMGEMDEGSASQAVGIDVDSCILKPFVPKDLEEKIEIVLQERNNPSAYRNMLHAARELSMGKTPHDALTYYDTAISLEPEKPMAYYFLGKLHDRLGDREKARNAYETALALNPGYIRALDGLSSIYAEAGEKEKLFYVMSVLIHISPRDAERRFHMGSLAMEIEDLETGRSSLMKAVELEPENERRVYEAGKLLLQHNFLNESAKIFEALVARFPGSWEYLNCCGETYRKKGVFEKARHFFLAALKITEDETIHYNMARLYIALGSKRLAEYHLEAALALKPGFSEARMLMERVEEMLDRVKAHRRRKS